MTGRSLTVSFILKVPGPAGLPPERKPCSFPTCDHPKVEVRRRTQGNGVVVAVRQCLACGGNCGAVPKASVDVDSLKEWNEALREMYRAARNHAWEEKRASDNEAWREWYDRYLASPEWHRKRQLVLKRDGYRCRGCDQQTATQVHHLTYERVGREMLFDLVSICDRCHKLCHAG